MVTFGCAFINTVMTFYTLYLSISRGDEFIQTVAVMRLQWQLFWSFLVLIVIQVASQVIREVNLLNSTCNEGVATKRIFAGILQFFWKRILVGGEGIRRANHPL